MSPSLRRPLVVGLSLVIALAVVGAIIFFVVRPVSGGSDSSTKWVKTTTVQVNALSTSLDSVGNGGGALSGCSAVGDAAAAMKDSTKTPSADLKKAYDTAVSDSATASASCVDAIQNNDSSKLLVATQQLVKAKESLAILKADLAAASAPVK